MNNPTSGESLRRLLQARYPGLRVAAMESAEDQRIELVGTRQALLTSGLVQASWFVAAGRARRREGCTEFGDLWTLRALRGGRFLLTLAIEAGSVHSPVCST